MDKLKVIDLFCGAGGFSEGFRQAGFEVVQAVDNWNPAIEAHRVNQPETKAIKADLEKEFQTKEEIEARFSTPLVLIGGPPCTEFSGSNRGGSGDVAKGMKLVEAFFRFVHVLKPKYWIMENVPRLLQTLPNSVPLRDLGIDKAGDFLVPIHRIPFNSADYGAPQRRLRALTGRFPNPTQTHSEKPTTFLDGQVPEPWVTMRTVVDAFPNPIGRVPRGTTIEDPNYPGLMLMAEELEDHFMKPEDSLMTKEEAEKNRRQKVAHAYYGKMQFPDLLDKRARTKKTMAAFPDLLDRPARTVMATQFNASRETMVIATKHEGEICYRKPSVRECASFQAFPITYRFPGKTLATKYRLVGNAVPVKLAVAVAKAILKEEGHRVPEEPMLVARPLSTPH